MTQRHTKRQENKQELMSVIVLTALLVGATSGASEADPVNQILHCTGKYSQLKHNDCMGAYQNITAACYYKEHVGYYTTCAGLCNNKKVHSSRDKQCLHECPQYRQLYCKQVLSTIEPPSSTVPANHSMTSNYVSVTQSPASGVGLTWWKILLIVVALVVVVVVVLAVVGVVRCWKRNKPKTDGLPTSATTPHDEEEQNGQNDRLLVDIRTPSPESTGDMLDETNVDDDSTTDVGYGSASGDTTPAATLQRSNGIDNQRMVPDGSASSDSSAATGNSSSNATSGSSTQGRDAVIEIQTKIIAEDGKLRVDLEEARKLLRND